MQSEVNAVVGPRCPRRAGQNPRIRWCWLQGTRGAVGTPSPSRTLYPIVALALSALLAGAAEHRLASAADITRTATLAKPGDVLLMRDGLWKDEAIVFAAKGVEGKPITLRAETPGKVILTGKSSMVIEGAYLIVSGLFLRDGTLTGDGVKLAGRNNRLTECAVVGGDYKFFVHMFGTSNRMDRCYLAEKTNDSPTLQIEVEGRPNFHRVAHNHFGPRPPLGRNGGETIRVGYSHQSMTNSGTLVEHNLFERCDGEIEIISNKSCENTYRANTFLDCAGMLTLRHGNRCIVDGNFFIGHHKRGSGGIRIIGEDHVVINNYIDGVESGGFWITSGISNSELKGYFQSRNCVIAFNTFVDSRGPAIELDAGFGSSRRTLRPENITIANNIFSSIQGPLLKGTEGGSGYKWMGNIASGAGEHRGIQFLDPKLERVDGLWRPAENSPARDGGDGDFPFVTHDIDGQPRAGRRDIGCDERVAGAAVNRPLRPADVGPTWREGTK